MKAPKNVAARKRMIVLYEALGDADVREDLFVVAFEKKSALIAENARLEDKDSGQGGRDFFDGFHFAV